MQIGVNLFSIRNLISTPEQCEQTFDTLKDMGVTYVQYSGGPYDVALLQKCAKILPIVLTHVPMDRILNEPQQLCEEHKSFGCTNIGLGMMPLDIIKDEQKCKETIAALNESGKVMQQNGCKLFYHFHHFEFYKFSDGTRIVDYIIDNCPYVNFTADTYWIQYGGASVTEYLGKMDGRIECVHLKDYKIVVNDKGEFAPIFAPLSEGNQNYADIVPVARKCGAKYFLIEQDNAAKTENPMGQIEISVKAALGWQF